MPIEMRELIQACWKSPIFGDSYSSSVPYADFERLTIILEEAFVTSFTPIITEGMPEVSLEVHNAYARALSFHAIGLFSNLGVELSDIDSLTRAYVCFGLLFWGDSLLDRGDPAIEPALIALLEESGLFLTPAFARSLAGVEPKTFNPPRPHAMASTPAQFRFDALRKIAPQILCLSRPEDASVLLHARLFDVLKHTLEIRRLNRLYMQKKCSDFWDEYAYKYAKHSILGMSLFGYIGLIYVMYRQENPDLPSLAEILEEHLLMRFVDGLANAAARIFDDAGDREIDSGAKQLHIPLVHSLVDAPAQISDNPSPLRMDSGAGRCGQINLFNIRDPRLIRAFFHLSGVMDIEVIGRAMNAFQAKTREGDSAVLQIFVDQLREQMNALPREILQRYSVFITLTKRCIETAYINAMGDDVFGL